MSWFTRNKLAVNQETTSYAILKGMSEILIVDDERAIREGLKNLLTGEGFDVRTARDGDDALKKIAERRPDLVLLDVMMPKANGFCCCEAIRRSDACLPVVFLTAKDADVDMIRGFGLGADDYIQKGTDDAVLLARLTRALERSAQLRNDGVGIPVIRLGGVTVDQNSLVVREQGREIGWLTRTEGDLLKFFHMHRGEFFVLDDLITELRGNGFACEDAMLYMHISRLRRKLGAASEKLVHRRGVGYGLLC